LVPADVNTAITRAHTKCPDGVVDIHVVVQRWSTNQKDEAVHAFLLLYETNAAVERYRPYNMTEQQFAALPSDEWPVLRGEMAAFVEPLREFVDEVDRRGKNAISEGDFKAAARIYDALEKLAQANIGRDVPLLFNLIGKWVDKRVKAGQAELHARLTTQPAQD